MEEFNELRKFSYVILLEILQAIFTLAHAFLNSKARCCIRCLLKTLQAFVLNLFVLKFPS